jgi:hypothetical protein
VAIPVSGLILIPLTLGIFCFTSYLGEWAVFCAVLQGAALVNLSGGFAVALSPYFFVAALIAARIIPRWAMGKIGFFAKEPVATQVRILAIFTAWCVFSAFVLPVLFEGNPVDDPRAGVDKSYYIQASLHWTSSNLGQAGYMILNFAMIMYVVQLAIRPARLERLVGAFSWSGVFVAAVGALQIACPHLGVPFPTWLFNSNKVWAQLTNQHIAGDFSRMSATFVEPSEAAGFLAAWSVFELSLAISGGPRNGRHWLWAGVGSFMLIKTTSTTGYITAGIMWIVMAWDCSKSILYRGWIKIKGSLAVLVLGGAALVALFTVPGAWLLLDAVLLNKGQSQSALHRTASFERAVQVFQNSWGLGVGLGSNRAMSVFFYVLSNLGFPGLLLAVVLLAQLFSEIQTRIQRPQIERTTRSLMTALGSAFVANLIALLASGAEITQPRLWILWGLLLATIRKDWFLEGLGLPAGLPANPRLLTLPGTDSPLLVRAS